jgi:hypothetical protein
MYTLDMKILCCTPAGFLIHLDHYHGISQTTQTTSAKIVLRINSVGLTSFREEHGGKQFTLMINLQGAVIQEKVKNGGCSARQRASVVFHHRKKGIKHFKQASTSQISQF